LDAQLRHLRMLGEDRLQHTRSHLHRLLHHVIESAMLDGSKAVDEIARWRLGPGLLAKLEANSLFRSAGYLRPPFPVAAIEDENCVSFAHPQDIDEIVGLFATDLDLPALGKIVRQK